MKLYWFQVAPNPTKVRLYIAEKIAAGAAIELEGVVVKLHKGEQHSPAHRARNPFETLPFLGSSITLKKCIPCRRCGASNHAHGRRRGK